MTIITDSKTGNTYWMPDILPEFSEEYNKIQKNKTYYTPEGEIKQHPQWFYDNQALVCDEYLFQNEGWKFCIDNFTSVKKTLSKNQILLLNPESEWNIEEKQVTPSFQVYNVSYELKPNVSFNQNLTPKQQSEWELDKDNSIAKVTWEITDLSEQSVEIKKRDLWLEIRKNISELLKESDVIVTRSYEKSIPVHNDIISYRQKLRDFTSTIENIEDFDGIYPSLPNKLDDYL